MLKRILIPALIPFVAILAFGKLFGQEQDHSIKVYSETRQQFPYAWAGGMNSCQFAKLDMNLDGVKDLVVFDRTGDRIMPFLSVQSGDDYYYSYAPGFAANFPLLSHWAIFVDYNLDGKEDIFTWSPGYAGLKVYRNTSENDLEFTIEVYPFLTSFQGGGYVNILVTYADYPAIVDLDGDGDLDILTFWGLGSFVEKHRNMSMEKYGHADSLDFVKTDFCWGYFAESEESNELALDTCLRCGSGEAGKHGGMEAWGHGISNGDFRHTGSTFQILDLNADGLPDLLLGDVDYPNLIALHNGGNNDTARMVSYDWQYPPGDKPVDLFSMPAAFYADFDFDGINDLVVSPFDPNPFLTDNFHSAWLYRNEGNNDQPQFNLLTKNFLQDKMIDFGAGAYPVFCDIDGDNLTDLLIGNYGYYDTSWYDQFMILHTEQTGMIAYLRNTGTAGHPAFTIYDRDFAGASALDIRGIVPAFGDLDGDGDYDVLLGCETGKIIFYLNKANPGEPASLELEDMNYQGIDVGDFSAPALFDLDKDDLPDLIIGEKKGNLNFFRNSGSLEKPVFTFVTDSLGKVNVTDYSLSLDGYSVPLFYKDALDETHLLVGSESGEILYFTGIDEFNFTGAYERNDTLAGLIGIENLETDRGYRSATAMFDLDLDGYPELIAGNFSGGLESFGKNNQSPVNQVNSLDLPGDVAINVFPNPAHELINISCTDCSEIDFSDIYLYDYLGKLIFQYSGSLEGNFLLNAESLPGGIYVLRMILKSKSLKYNYIFTKKILFL
jgi:hypothetical protein